MNHLVKIGVATTIRVPVIETALLDNAEAMLYRRDGTEAWTAAQDVTPPHYPLTADAARATDELTVDLTGRPSILRGDEMFLAKAASPEDNPTESVQVAFQRGSTVTIEHTTVFDWVAGDLLVPHWFEVDIDAGDIDTLARNLRITVNSQRVGVATERGVVSKTYLIDVVAHVPSCLLTVAAMRKRLPGTFSPLAGNMGRDDAGFDCLIEQAFQLTLADINHVIPPDLIISDSDCVEPTFAKVRQLLAEDGRYLANEPDRLSVIRDTTAQYQAALDKALRNIGWTDKNQDHIVDPDEERRSLSRRVHLSPY